MEREVIEVVVKTPLYEIRHERWRFDASDEWMTMSDRAYTPTGDYIGDAERARVLCDEHGIAPERRTLDSSICSIGFSEKEQRWYGWSHRAIYGFGVGDAVDSENHVCAHSGWIGGIDPRTGEKDPLPLPVGFTAQSLEDAKRMATAFAAAVA